MSAAVRYDEPELQDSAPAQQLASSEQQRMRPSGPSGLIPQQLSARGTGADGTVLGGARRGASLAEQGYVHARFGNVPVLVGPELAAEIRAMRQERS
jgi:hypothetical protein